MSLEVGGTAPPFTLPDASGNEVSLEDFRGKHVILYFYPKDNTSGCTKEALGFRDLVDEFRKRGVIVIGVSPDSEASHRKFAEKNNLPFLLLSDPEKKAMTAYGVFGEKKMYGKPVRGVIRSTVWIGPDGKVIRHWPKVANAADHPRKVLEAIRAAL